MKGLNTHTGGCKRSSYLLACPAAFVESDVGRKREGNGRAEFREVRSNSEVSHDYVC